MEPAVKKIIDLSQLGNSGVIDNFLMENCQLYDDYALITLSIYYIIILDMTVTCIQTLLETCCSDIGICVNGYTLLQHMVILNKRKDYIQKSVEAGIFLDGFSEATYDGVLTIVCKQLIQFEHNWCTDSENCFDILEYLLSSEIKPSIKDLTHVAFVYFNYEEVTTKPTLKAELELLTVNSDVFNAFMYRLRIYANQKILKGNKHSLRSLWKLNLKQIAKIMMNKNFKGSLNKQILHFQTFGILANHCFDNASQLATQMSKAIKHLKRYLKLNHDSAWQIISYLTDRDLHNLNGAFSKVSKIN